MQIDGITISALTREIERTLTGIRIDKIQSPSYDCMTLGLGRGHAKSLLISASSKSGRICLTDSVPPSLPTPTAFCMLMRKHLVGGKVVSIRQDGLDRILIIQIEGWADAGPADNRLLIAEITGRLANIILTQMDGTIIDAVNRVDQSRNRYREIAPGAIYIPPPPIEKPDPLDVTAEEFHAAVIRQTAQMQARAAREAAQAREAGSRGKQRRYSAAHLLSRCFEGIGQDHSEEIARRAGIGLERSPLELGTCDIESLWVQFQDFRQAAKSGDFLFEAAFDRKTGEPAVLSVWGLSGLPEEYEVRRFASASEMIDNCYGRAEERERLESAQRDITRKLQARLARSLRKLEAQRTELAKAQDASVLRRKGELLTANLHSFGRGPLRKDVVSVIDYYDPQTPTVEVEVDPGLSASENAQSLFARYSKAERAREAVSANIETTQDEVAYLESMLAMVEIAESESEVVEITQELGALGFIQPQKEHGNARKAKKTHGRKAPMPAKFKAPSGHEIYVGKNNLQNDYLTMRLARDHDLWFHAREIHGAHVIVRRRPNEDLPEETLHAAALLAAYYSQARMSSNVAIDYTEAKNVRKPRRARPGMVIYESHKTIWVTPSRDALSDALGLRGSSTCGNDD
ncbi:MAG: NFACT RNA binding domain-containing protein [Firmicutes bacterium]|jgi:predicted ribosome quality control (RQC) complex YloA/Tae2 family protein|nr:NFACT RNA binding domain-containing protein [Bacillota bacterium]